MPESQEDTCSGNASHYDHKSGCHCDPATFNENLAEVHAGLEAETAPCNLQCKPLESLLRVAINLERTRPSPFWHHCNRHDVLQVLDRRVVRCHSELHHEK